MYYYKTVFSILIALSFQACDTSSSNETNGSKSVSSIAKEDINQTTATQTNSSSNEMTICTTEYAPVCGAKEVQCVTTPCYPISTTYSNRCNLNSAKAVYLFDGRCEDGINKTPQNCTSWNDGCNDCASTNMGAVCTKMYCEISIKAFTCKELSQ